MDRGLSQEEEEEVEVEVEVEDGTEVAEDEEIGKEMSRAPEK